jgi:hypothetical protein
MVQRRSRLLLLACMLAIADALLLGWRWHRDTAANGLVTYAGLDSITMMVDADVPRLGLRGGSWFLDKAPADPAAYAKGLAAEGHMPVVSASTYRQFLVAVRDLKARKVCNVLIAEGGQLEKAAPMSKDGDVDTLTIPAFVLCGRPIGDAGFQGVLPPDGPVHVPEAAF